MSNLEQPMDVAEYLFRRLGQAGVKSVHGVPGDYNLVALDYVSKCDLKWVGNCNELNAGYAADGYARITGLAALVTTFGVGELSALNAVAGAYSEYVPVVHIVGCPSTISQRNGMLLHHTLGNGDFRVFEHMSANISVAVERLNDASKVADQIDSAIQACYIQSRPVYLMLPTDIVQKKVDGARLKTPLDLTFPSNEEEKEDYVVDVVLKYLHAAKNPVILVDACADRHRALKETHALIQKSGLPVFVTPMGKGSIDETLPNYGGVYAGTGSNAGVKERVESSDLVISIGAIKSDFNTAGFSYSISQLNTIDFHSYKVKVRYSEYPGVRMNGVLKKVTEKLDTSKLQSEAGPKPDNKIPSQEDTKDAEAIITHAWFWPRLGQWLQSNDIVITETGTANFGIWNTRFPKDVSAIAQVLWGSIGYATGACQGAALAASEDKERFKRTILITGDGSFQLTAQEISTMLRHNLDPIIFVICNQGYTIERFIHGMDASYNDTWEWRYKDLPNALGAQKDQAQTYVVKTKADVEKLLSDQEFSKQGQGKLRLVELYMAKEDAPDVMKTTAEESAKINSKLE